MLPAMVLGFFLFTSSPPWTTTHVYSRQGWFVSVQHDRFSGKTACRITTDKVVLNRDTLLFKMGTDALTADAHFRVDNGPVKSVREVLALDEARGFFPDRGWIEDPSENRVAIPLSYAHHADTVWIRANSQTDPRGFKVRGLDYVLKSAAELGCPVRAT